VSWPIHLQQHQLRLFASTMSSRTLVSLLIFTAFVAAGIGSRAEGAIVLTAPSGLDNHLASGSEEAYPPAPRQSPVNDRVALILDGAHDGSPTSGTSAPAASGSSASQLATLVSSVDLLLPQLITSLEVRASFAPPTPLPPGLFRPPCFAGCV